MKHMHPTLFEAKRLYDLGFAIHWLHPKSKRPVESGWTTGPRKTWKELETLFRPNYNVGVRLGEASKLKGGYLAVVDVDVKGSAKKHRKEASLAALNVVETATGKLDKVIAIPEVTSGRGNGSRHFYILTPEPFKTFNPAQSKELVKVHMPSKSPSKKELKALTKEEIDKGIRISPAWEVSLYSHGRQVVLPPSIHPDSKKPYEWRVGIKSASDIPLADFSDLIPEDDAPVGDSPSAKSATDRPAPEKFTVNFSPISVEWTNLSDKMKAAIRDGKGVEDRSAYLLPACEALLKQGLDRDEVLSVLTDKETYLGKCAFEHAKTSNRERAAYWLYKYTLKRVIEETSAEALFEKHGVIENVKANRRETKALEKEVDSKTHWRAELDTDKHGTPKPTLMNCVAIMKNSCLLPGFVGRNEFAANDYYLCDSPWESKKGQAVADHDIVRIKVFCAENFGVEFGDNIVNQALMHVADKNRFHPVRNWIKTLRWDGVPRIETWLKDFAGAQGPDEYLKAVSRKILVALVARVFEPGCKFDYVLILEGLQGMGKSTLLSDLVSEAWFSDQPLNIGDKDAILTMQSKWLIEMGELSAMKRAEVEQLKAFITQRTDRIRAPYGKRVEDFPRQCVFFGTTNSDEYLPDLTGNRRFWPVKVGGINFGEIASVREQLFAEALCYYELGEPLYLEDAEINALAGEEQGKRMHGDEWISMVSEILESGMVVNLNAFEIKEVAEKMDMVGANRMTFGDVQRISRCLKLLGYESYRESGGGRRRLWGKNTVGGARPRSSKVSKGTLDVTNDSNCEGIEDFY